ncbi:AzlC family ABC transporter permease [Streptomyces sp. SID8352]|uniref:AzlC family ABC transporter permease n=1 Tax=Streptomyces sp. SID8352 TaxID=2690338 RepID=UPI00136F72D7|nr:AzlC family ABC transporter permease [Streptomyces sp. SID8352]MYU20476.1 branched-chain amino acid ABC transporter permease [Streptomyces sp. SID8352]
MSDAVNEDTPAPAGAGTAAGTAAGARGELWAGARAMAPFMIAAFPMGIVAGAAGIAGGVGWLGTLGMGVAVNSGTAMLAGLQLLRDGSPWPVILLTTMVLSLRMTIYAIMLRPHLRDLPQRWRALLAFGLVDATFFIVIERFGKPVGVRERQWYFLGSAAAMFANWTSSLALGMALGSAVPDIAGESLEFPMTALFIAMMAATLTHWKLWISVLVAGALALAAHPLPYNLYVVVATLGGAVAGSLCEVWDKRRARTTAAPDDPETV